MISPGGQTNACIAYDIKSSVCLQSNGDIGLTVVVHSKLIYVDVLVISIFGFFLFFSILFHTQFSIYSIEQRNAVINVKVSLWLSAVSEPVFVDFFSFLFTSRRQKYAMLRSDRRKKKKINCFGFPFDNHKNSENGETIIGFYKVSARIYCQANQWINIERIRY